MPSIPVSIDLTRILGDLTSNDDTLAEAAARELESLPDESFPPLLAALKALLKTPDPDHRWWAVRALSAVPKPQISRLLIDALIDEDITVRQCAALGLRIHPDPQAVPALVQALQDKDPLMEKLAADALIAVGKQATPALLEVLENGQKRVRLQAVRALALIGDTSAIPALFSTLDEGSALMEYWATQGLERMGVGMLFFNPGG